MSMTASPCSPWRAHPADFPRDPSEVKQGLNGARPRCGGCVRSGGELARRCSCLCLRGRGQRWVATATHGALWHQPRVVPSAARWRIEDEVSSTSDWGYSKGPPAPATEAHASTHQAARAHQRVPSAHELVDNAVIHARTSSWLTFHLNRRGLRIAVTACAPTARVEIPPPSRPATAGARHDPWGPSWLLNQKQFGTK